MGHASDDFENNDIEVNRFENNEPPPGGFDSNFKQERRNTKRFDERLSARIENEKCVVLNVSNRGVLLQTTMPVYFFPLSKTIEFELQVEEEWIHIIGKVMWVQSDVLHSKIGLFIQHAPEPYFNFLKNLYE
ncbi:MAG: PilZ domain-containing protein [Candidatus Aminicenantes bacterium]|nr:MAG: PilZ domain-containing protein [Candidatus Aminicenantes bacterium]